LEDFDNWKPSNTASVRLWWCSFFTKYVPATLNINDDEDLPLCLLDIDFCCCCSFRLEQEEGRSDSAVSKVPFRTATLNLSSKFLSVVPDELIRLARPVLVLQHKEHFQTYVSSISLALHIWQSVTANVSWNRSINWMGYN